ncbi:MAG: S8 family serine peptidase [Bacteroidota bacterium]
MTAKKCLWAFFALCFIAFSCNEEDASVVEEPTDESLIPNQYIVVFKDGTMTSGRSGEPVFTDRNEKIAYSQDITLKAKKEMASFFSENQLSSDKISTQYTSLFSGFAATLTAEEVAKLENDPRVDFVEQDRILTLDAEVEAIYEEHELPTGAEGGRAEMQTTTCAISNAGGAVSGVGKQTWIWIVDTGIDLDHPDLNVRTDFSRTFIDGSADDANGHGTHVAGIAAAVSNSVGVVGVSAGATVVAVDVLGSGSAPTSTIIAGMDYVASNDISGDVVNMSLGPRNRTGCSTGSAYRSALNRLNDQSFIALAAGNSSDDAAFYDPACHNLTRVYTVASMTCGGGFSSFSNFGSPVDFIATGSSVLSTYSRGRYATLSGTSMASPVVAGVLHARGAAPRQCGSVSFGGRTYRVACR